MAQWRKASLRRSRSACQRDLRSCSIPRSISKNIADSGRHTNFINLVTFSHELVKDVTLYVEGWSDYNNDPVQKTTQYSFDFAVAWLVRRNLQLDAGIDFGLNSSTPKVQVFAGISQRF